MSKKRKALVPCLALFLLLAAGGLNRQVVLSTQSPEGTKSPKSAPAAPFAENAGKGIWQECDLIPGKVLDQLLHLLHPEQLSWQNITLWQRLHDGELPFEAESTLLRGPHQCVRWEMKVRTRDAQQHLEVVSDGHTLAESLRHADLPPEIQTEFLPSDKKAREDVLSLRGCGGLYPLVANIRHLSWQVRLDQGEVRGQAVYRLSGLTPAQAGNPTKRCRLYLDQKTLHPVRLEWWSATPGQPEKLQVEMEVRRCILNQPLNERECVQAFSFSNEKRKQP